VPRSSMSAPGRGNLWVWLLGAAALVVLWVVLALAAVVLVPAAVVLAGLVVWRPEGAGARIRTWRVWRRLPGMSGASRGAAGFAALLMLYVGGVPSASFALLEVASHSSGGGHSVIAQAGATPEPTAAEPEVIRSPPPTSASAATPEPTAVATAAPTPEPSAAPTPVPTDVPTPVPTRPPTRTPAPKPAPTAPPPPPPTQPPANTCGAPPNPWNYGFCSGTDITNPPGTFCDYFACINNFWNGVGYVIECTDGMYSKSGGRSGACSYHQGVWRALLQP